MHNVESDKPESLRRWAVIIGMGSSQRRLRSPIRWTCHFGICLRILFRSRRGTWPRSSMHMDPLMAGAAGTRQNNESSHQRGRCHGQDCSESRAKAGASVAGWNSMKPAHCASSGPDGASRRERHRQPGADGVHLIERAFACGCPAVLIS